MSIIKRITVQTYAYELDDVGANVMVFEKGGKSTVTKFVVSIETNDGHIGSYAPHYGSSSSALAQAKDMAPALIGQNAEQREKIFEDLKIAWRHFDRVGIAAIDLSLIHI